MMSLRGRPPFKPFFLAAAVLASDFAEPPSVPNATAAGFLRGRAAILGRLSLVGEEVRVLRLELQHPFALALRTGDGTHDDGLAAVLAGLGGGGVVVKHG